MAKKGARGKGGQVGVTDRADLKSLRNKIDHLDLQILKILNERAKVAQEIGKVKSAEGAEIFSPARETEVVERLLGQNQGPLDERTIRAVYRELMSGSRALQRLLRIAYLGPEYSFSHLAALERFGTSVDFVAQGNIPAVFEMVNRGQAEFGVVPIENSTDGRVTDTLDMFLRLPLKICAEITLRVHHNLISHATLGAVHRVYSKWNALSQCRHWLAANLPRVDLCDTDSTTKALEFVQRDRNAAAVASRQAAVAYGVPILCADIEDRRNNRTRFAVIGNQVADRTGDDKTTIMFQLPDEPGALCDALAIVKKNEVNMSWIESFPGPEQGKERDWLFFADLEGHQKDAPIDRSLSALDKKCTKLVVLGTFPRGAAFD